VETELWQGAQIRHRQSETGGNGDAPPVVTAPHLDSTLIDELGYLTLKPEQINAFFKLMGERYGKTTTIITTNLEYPDWYELFQKKSLVDALLDRLKHRCITIKIDGPSLRAPSIPCRNAPHGHIPASADAHHASEQLQNGSL
jgi:hypothetical protein